MNARFFFFLLWLPLALSANKVDVTTAQKVADNVIFRQGKPYEGYRLHAGHTLDNQGLTCIYLFNYEPYGFVLVAADDAVIPVLGYSTEDSAPWPIQSPSAKAWLESYSHEIYRIRQNKLDNQRTKHLWAEALSVAFKASSLDIEPLLNTKWGQKCYFNEDCPTDAQAAPDLCGHTFTGCVATAMAQIMKYYSWPATDMGSFAYTLPQYGQQAANFGQTTYNWSQMPNLVVSSNPFVAELLYHCGVSVMMNYGVQTSIAFDGAVVNALKTYFNYNPRLTLVTRSSLQSNTQWDSLLVNELSYGRPIYYSGVGEDGSHAFVCDGYRESDGKFHFNWGWNAYYNGYYTIGNLNPGGSTYNQSNTAIIGIQPNPFQTIVKLSSPPVGSMFKQGQAVNIKAKVTYGHAQDLLLYIDRQKVAQISGDSLTYSWNTIFEPLGFHNIHVEAVNEFETVADSLLLNLSRWEEKSTRLQLPGLKLTTLDVVDSSTAWGIPQTNSALKNTEYMVKTTNGGETWTSKPITGVPISPPSMLCGVDTLHAWLAFPFGMLNNQGVYITVDGGNSWSRQACFNNTNSRARLVHFFNVNQGVAIGDPVAYFEIYTTGNMGISWQRVPSVNLPMPLPAEVVADNSLSVVDETLWFATSFGRIFKSIDKGFHWTAIQTPADTAVEPIFKDQLHGLLVDRNTASEQILYRTADGGINWDLVNTTGPFLGNDICYVPNTPGTWVSTGCLAGHSGASYSFDDGTTWQRFAGTDSIPFYEVEFCSNHFGLAGGTTLNDSTRGAFRFTDTLQASLEPPQDLTVTSIGTDAVLDWLPPIGNLGNLVAYAIYREGLFIASVAPTLLTYTDNGLSNGYYHYCIKAAYTNGSSPQLCAATAFTVNAPYREQMAEVKISLMDFSQHLYITASDAMDEIRFYSMAGQMILKMPRPENPVLINLNPLQKGLYLVEVVINGKKHVRKVVK
jgi:photosystem II stability/assembly factor-like uncharacterized protein